MGDKAKRRERNMQSNQTPIISPVQDPQTATAPMIQPPPPAVVLNLPRCPKCKSLNLQHTGTKGSMWRPPYERRYRCRVCDHPFKAICR